MEEKEKTKKTRRKKEVKTKEENTLPIKISVPENKQEIQTVETQKMPVRKVRQPRQHSPVAEVLVNICQKLVKKGLLLIIFWVFLSMGVLLTGSYIIFKEFRSNIKN